MNMSPNTHSAHSCATSEKLSWGKRALAAFLCACALSFTLLSLAGCFSEPAAEEAPAADQPQEQVATVSVEVTVDSSAADGSVSYSETLDLEEGATALDALKATGLDVSVETSDFGAYVTNVGGLANGQHGGMSGWMYKVNGEFAEVGCDAYELADGDVLTWEYSVG